jgi:tetraacyldisaccharide 4'-kinase
VSALQPILVPLSWLYGGGVRVRNAFYDAGVCKSERFGVPVVSVGNITAGGTGKTPFVEYLVQYFTNKRKRVAVLSRGYRRASTGTVVVSDGTALREGPDRSGDEPYQIARRFPGAAVISDERRRRSARIAVDELHAEAIILDDGFQHRAISRDLDIVMLRPGERPGWTPMLPAGLRREPLSSLRRAGLVAVSEGAGTNREPSDLKRYTSAPIIRVRFKPDCIFRVFGMERLSSGHLAGKKVMAFCGIANPAGFENTLREMETDLAETMRFPDHHRFTTEEFRRIRDTFERSEAAMILTTEKDAVRCATPEGESILGALPFCFIRLSTEIIEGGERLHSLLDSLLGGG